MVEKITSLVRLNAVERAAIDALLESGVTTSGEQLLYRVGEPPAHAFLITRGMAFRFKSLAGGQRQIFGYLIPGDLCGLRCSLPNPPDHDVLLLGHSIAVRIEKPAIADLIASFPAIERGLALAALADRAILREWLFNVGQRNSVQRLSHFFCEMAVRLAVVGEVDDDGSFALPIDQTMLADTIGLTPVHINRTLQRLRSAGLISLRHGRLAIIDFERLAQLAGFDEDYLNIMRCGD